MLSITASNEVLDKIKEFIRFLHYTTMYGYTGSCMTCLSFNILKAYYNSFLNLFKSIVMTQNNTEYSDDGF